MLLVRNLNLAWFIIVIVMFIARRKCRYNFSGPFKPQRVLGGAVTGSWCVRAERLIMLQPVGCITFVLKRGSLTWSGFFVM